MKLLSHKMKTIQCGTTLLTGITLLFFLAACKNVSHESISPDDPQISKFELNEHNAYIYEDTIEIAWYSGMAIDRQYITGLTILDEAILLPITDAYISAAFPGTKEPLSIIESVKETPANLNNFIEKDALFNVPALTMPIDLSTSITVLVIGKQKTIKKYTIIVIVNVEFKSNGGSDVDPHSITTTYGETIDQPSNPSKPDYLFDGWFRDNDTFEDEWQFDENTLKGDTTLYAKWDEIKTIYTVTFYNNGGTGTIPVQRVDDGSSIILPDGDGFSKDNCTFANWNTESSGMGTIYPPGSSYVVTRNATFSAMWLREQSFNISLGNIIDYGPVLTDITIYHSYYNGPVSATLMVDTPDQYTRIEWYYNGNSLGTGVSLKLDSSDIRYNMIGPKFLTVEVIKDGIPYNTTIVFTVLE